MSIIYYPNDVLLKKTEAVNFEKDSKSQIESWKKEMVEEMIKQEGIGLAANQIGLNKSMCVIYLPTSLSNETILLINPEIVKNGKEKVLYKEGCLSFPTIQVDKQRFKIITVKYQNEDGTVMERVFKGVESVCVQHEIDHLNGITFVDDLSEVKKNEIVEKINVFTKMISKD